jgi:hypothetical protein
MSLENAKYNQNLYNNLSNDEKNKWIDKVYKYYNKNLPLIKYNKNKINESFKNLKNKQNYKIIKTNFNLIKYRLFNLLKFINETYTINKSTHNCILEIIDIDYKINYFDFCLLSDYYQNNERMTCTVKYQKNPINYYKNNYKKLLEKYFSKMYTNFEDGFSINKLNFNTCDDCVNSIYLQGIMYEDNKFCTIYKPYLFKLLIQIFKSNHNANILDLSSGWGDRLIAVASIEDDINLYIGIDPNKKLFPGYNKIINDLIKDKNKIKLINDKSENIDYNTLPELDIIFWSPPFFDQEIYINEESREDFKNQSVQQFKSYDAWESHFIIDVINRSSNNLKKNGVFILYIGNIDYNSFMKKINYINKIKFIGNLKITTVKHKSKNYMIFLKNCDANICKIMTKKNLNLTMKIKKIIISSINPPLKIIDIHIDKLNIHVVQDGYLLAGTKMRAAELFINHLLTENKNIKTLVYSGTANGFGSVAVAYAAYKCNLKSNIFINGNETDIINSKQYNALLLLGAKVYLCNNYTNSKNLKYDLSRYITTNGHKDKKDYYIIPMGLNDSDKIMINLLSQQLKKIIDFNINRIWLVSGSGGILEALYKVFPNAHFFIYTTGRGIHLLNVLNFIKNNKNITRVNDFNINDVVNDYYKYYKSVKNYDDFIFPYVKKYGKNGDFIWNIASDELL